eukprot:4199948-Pyramimonas_sp.AAC.1
MRPKENVLLAYLVRHLFQQVRKYFRVKIVWDRAHQAENVGNDFADYLAKQGSRLDSEVPKWTRPTQVDWFQADFLRLLGGAQQLCLPIHEQMQRQQKRLEVSCPEFLVGDLTESNIPSPLPRTDAEGKTLPTLGHFTNVIASVASRCGRGCPRHKAGAVAANDPLLARVRDLQRQLRVEAESHMRKQLAKDIYRLRRQISRMRSTAKLNEALKTKRFPGRPKARPRIP